LCSKVKAVYSGEEKKKSKSTRIRLGKILRRSATKVVRMGTLKRNLE
jgi:hypothetical protein